MNTIDSDYANENLEMAYFQKQRPCFYDQLDYLPLISTITGIARIAFGGIETLFGVLVVPLELIRDACSKGDRRYTVIEGVKNVFRGYVAIHPLVGNVLLYLYDHTRLFTKN